MKKDVLKYALLISVLVTGFFSWFSIYRAMNVPAASIWVVPAIWFSLYVIFVCLAAVLVNQVIAVEVTVLVSFLLSLIFNFYLWYGVILFFCTLIMLCAVRDIKKDLDFSIKIRLWKSLFVGKFKVVIALAILISSQYFFFINKIDGKKIVPKFDAGTVTSEIIEPILGMVSPNFKKIQQEGITVDKFILESQKNNEDSFLADSVKSVEDQIPANLPIKEREALKQQALQQINDSKTQLLEKNKELVLNEGHRQFSQMTGKEITGNEKISDVFVGFVGKKINDLFQPKLEEGAPPSFLSYIVTLILFLTIWPIGLILGLFWFVIVIIIFKILCFFDLVEIKEITVEKEAIV